MQPDDVPACRGNGFDTDHAGIQLIDPCRAAQIHDIGGGHAEQTPFAVDPYKQAHTLRTQQVEAGAVHGDQTIHVGVAEHDMRGEHAGRIRGGGHDGTRGVGGTVGQQDLPVGTVHDHFLGLRNDMAGVAAEIRKHGAIGSGLDVGGLSAAQCQERIVFHGPAVQHGGGGQQRGAVMQAGGAGDL